MNKIIVTAITLLLACPLAYAGRQYEKMKTCNASAKEKALKGDERKAFMKDCLSTN